MTGYDSKRQMAADQLWDKPSVACDEWWNGDNDESTNPFRLESGAYWAWAGWKAALAQPMQEPVFKWRSVFQEMPTEDSHLLFCFGVHVVEGSYTRHGWASLAYGEAQPDFWAYMPPPPHHKRNQELYAMPPQRPWVGLTEEDFSAINQSCLTKLQAATSAESILKEKNS